MKILVMCGAGASSTFVAQRVRRAAADRGLTVTVEAGAEAQILSDPVALDGVDVLLIGAHLAAHETAIRAAADPVGTAVAVLPADIFEASGGERALELALSIQSPTRR
ncbi:PTS IIB subunit [Plantibacter flavus]|uniref:PTS sugar transporter subunit IIB n=1 Tax=Plantibacter flavus TaxID=150123 RepID=UPI003F17563B